MFGNICSTLGMLPIWVVLSDGNFICWFITVSVVNNWVVDITVACCLIYCVDAGWNSECHYY